MELTALRTTVASGAAAFVLLLSPTIGFGQITGRLDVGSMIDSGEITFAITPTDIGSVSNIFDGNLDTLVRSRGINPFVLTLRLPRPIEARRFLFRGLGGLNDWSVEGAQTESDLDGRRGTYQQITTSAVPDTGPVEVDVRHNPVQVMRLTVRKRAVDPYVHVNEWQIFIAGSIEELVADFPISQMFPTWRFPARVRARHAAGPIALEPAVVRWTSSLPGVATIDAQGMITARAAGEATIRAEFGGRSVDFRVPVLAPVLPPLIAKPGPELAPPNPKALFHIPVLVLRFIPTRDGINVDTSYDADFWNLGEITVASMTRRLDLQLRRVRGLYEESTRFRGYKDAQAQPAITYSIQKVITVYEPVPPGKPVRNSSNGKTYYYPDMVSAFERFGVRRYVEEEDVREIWVVMGQANPDFPSFNTTIHPPDRARTGWESEMAGPNGRICNCGESTGLPTYNRTYTLYLWNSRRQDLAGHTRGHQLESMLSYVNRRDPEPTLFARQFVGSDAQGRFVKGRAGNVHFPPNGERDYDYDNKTLVESDIEDWTPDGTGQKKLVNSDTWRNLPYVSFDPERQGDIGERWYMYWMQNMPGWGNSIPGPARMGSGFRMSNWWQIEGDWDAAQQAGLSLTASQSRYRLSAERIEIDGGGGQRNIQIDGGSGPWIASSNANWVRVGSRRGGTGPAAITLQIAANTASSERVATVAIAENLLTIVQRSAAAEGIVPDGVVSAAGVGGGAVAPGSLISIYGRGLSLTELAAGAVPLPRTLAGVRVVVNGSELPLLYVSTNQINAQLPWEIEPGQTTLRVIRDGRELTAPLHVEPAAPVLFMRDGKYALAATPAGDLYSLERPAGCGEIVTLYLTGGGAPQSGSTATGEANPLEAIALKGLAQNVSLGTQEVPILYLGLAPGLVGVNQLNFRVPQRVPLADQEVIVRIHGRFSPPVLLRAGC